MADTQTITTRGGATVTWTPDGQTWIHTPPRGHWTCSGCSKNRTSSIVRNAEIHAWNCTHTPKGSK